MAKKTVDIQGKSVTFETTGLLPVLYQSWLNEDYFKDYQKLVQSLEENGSADLEVTYRMIYTLAKKADKDIPEMFEWYDSFEDGFPMIEVSNEVLPLIFSNIHTTIKKK